ncbi:MAG: exodeoxyribonuclease III [Betaproteobacteria bacterium]|nr:exodeoxyribonuclease III [Betaproteobacteria bacterium]MBK9608397.1 exodeoxyribonuclease III [Betaproteobacteria bacterium]
MKIATWNINSLKIRLPHVLAWLAEHQPDVLCLQELKLDDPHFPVDAIAAAGYCAVFSGQKTYNGVAILSRSAASDVQISIPGYDDPLRRVIAATVDGIRVVCFYVPNGQSVDSDKYQYKLQWLGRATDWLRGEVVGHERIAVTGDFNIAPEDRDVHDPELWRGQVLCTDAERAAFRGWVDLGLVDSFRLFEQPERTFSWWDYRMLGFQKNHGLRIDHILLSPALAKSCERVWIDRAERKKAQPSDHAPVVAELRLP